MDRFKGKIAIVTGASSGIGEAIAKKLVEDGLIVVALARRKSNLIKLEESLKEQPGKLYPQECDVSKEEDILRVFEWIKSNLGPIHVLINNAGTGRSKTLLDVKTEELQAILNTNVLGLTIATREAVNDMIKNDVNGHVIHVNSVAGHYVPRLPNYNIYPATKYAVTALTETLRQDLCSIGSKIKVTSISPGYVETEFAYRNGYTENEELAKLLKIVPRLASDDIADAVAYVLKTPPHVQVTELTIRPVGEQI